jgi:hypothetical protein
MVFAVPAAVEVSIREAVKSWPRQETVVKLAIRFSKKHPSATPSRARFANRATARGRIGLLGVLATNAMVSDNASGASLLCRVAAGRSATTQQQLRQVIVNAVADTSPTAVGQSGHRGVSALQHVVQVRVSVFADW